MGGGAVVLSDHLVRTEHASKRGGEEHKGGEVDGEEKSRVKARV